MPTRYVPPPKLEVEEDSDDSNNDVKQEDEDSDDHDHSDHNDDHNDDHIDDDDDDHSDANSTNSLISNEMFTEDKFDFLHLSDSYTRPLFPHPSCDPTPALQSAYNAQSIAYDEYEEARRERREFQLQVMEEELGRLMNLRRESEERERIARGEVRKETLKVMMLELAETADRAADGADGSVGDGNNNGGVCEFIEFNEWAGKLKSYIQKHKGLPPSLDQFDMDDKEEQGKDATATDDDDDDDSPKPQETEKEEEEEDDDNEENDKDVNTNDNDNEQIIKSTNHAKALATWFKQQQTKFEQHPTSFSPHQLATLESMGLVIPTHHLSSNDLWNKMFQQFQLFAKDYYFGGNSKSSNKNKVQQLLLGDTTRTATTDIMTFLHQYQYSNQKDVTMQQLFKWCTSQQKAFSLHGFAKQPHRLEKLMNAGFTFDVYSEDEVWEEVVAEVGEFKDKFGHLDIPKNYPPKESVMSSSSSIGASGSRGGGGGGGGVKSLSSSKRLNEFVTKVTTLIHHHALSPKRMAHLREVGLYLDLGGRVYKHHMVYARAGRIERGEKRRRLVPIIGGRGWGREEVLFPPKKNKKQRGAMDKWEKKLKSEFE